MATVLKGTLKTQDLGGKQDHMVLETTFGQARSILSADMFSAKNGRGEQRAINVPHARKIKKAMEDGTFTPTAWHAGTRPRHRKVLQITEESPGIRVASIEIEDKETLPLINGNHRNYALEEIRKEAEKAGDTERVALVDRQPITVLVLLDGNCQSDFVNLQVGKAVDKSHMLFLKLKTKQMPERHQAPMEMAMNISRLLYDSNRSPFYKQIRFDTQSSAPLSLHSLCSTGASDIGTSFVGLGRVCIDFGKNAKWAAELFNTVLQTFQEQCPDVLGDKDANENLVRKLLTPPPEGTNGGYGLFIGVVTVFAYYLLSQKRDEPTKADLKVLVQAVQETLDHSVIDLSAQNKRELLGGFARATFEFVQAERQDGVPVGLVSLLSPSTFGLSKAARVVEDKTTQSLDRIDSDKGYIDGNVTTSAGEPVAA